MLNVDQVNGLERHEFTHAFASLFEHSPWVAARTAAKRPFQDRAEFLAALCDTVMKANNDEKLCLIRAHPDLVGNAVLTAESGQETSPAPAWLLSPLGKGNSSSAITHYIKSVSDSPSSFARA